MLAEASTVYTEEQERAPTITADEARAAYRKAISEEQEDEQQTRSPSTAATYQQTWIAADASSYVEWFLRLRSPSTIPAGPPALRSGRGITVGGGRSTFMTGSRAVGGVRPLASTVWYGGDLELGSGDPRREYYDAAIEALSARERTAVEIAADIAELRAEALDEGIEINAASEAAFDEFVRRHQPTTVPALAVLDNGNIRAMWRRATGEQVGLQFRADGDIQFVFFVLRGGHLTSYADRDATDGVVERLKADGLIDLVTG